MKQTADHTLQSKEQFALRLAMYGNLFMGAAGVLAAALSNSQAILLDGMFSMIGFTAAIIAQRVSKRALSEPDRERPFGYALDESIFTTFRSLSLLGLVTFAIISALINIIAYFRGAVPLELNYGPMAIYFTVIGVTCFGLWFFHWQAWRSTGRKSDILRLESTSFAFDGAITAAAGVGLLGIQFFKDGPLAVIAPIGDSIIVLFLCAFAVLPYFRNFMSSLGELAGVTAAPKFIAAARRGIRGPLANWQGKLLDLTVLKAGRLFYVAVYLEPAEPISAEQVDKLSDEMTKALQASMGNVDVMVVISRRGR